MKKLSSLFAAALIAGMAFASTAQAATIDLSLGTVAVGASGTASTAPIKNLSYTASGKLAADTEVVFTLSSASIAAGLLTAAGSLGKNGSMIGATAGSMGALSTVGSLPVIAVAFLSDGMATVTIENLTSKAQAFTAYFLAAITGKTAFSITYAVSAVPLPASALLFAAALIAMAAFAYRRKQI